VAPAPPHEATKKKANAARQLTLQRGPRFTPAPPAIANF
jgi:hypothetical protein